MKVLFVCSGNICRSPLAEAVLRKCLETKGPAHVQVSSAGTLGIDGERADAGAAAAARGAGYDLSAHRSRPLTPEEIRASEFVLVMERRHREEVLEMDRRHPAVHLITEFLPEGDRDRGSDVRDPIGGGLAAHEVCRVLIERSVQAFHASILAGSRDRSVHAAHPDEETFMAWIAERVRTARGGAAILSPMEFHIADRWWQEGVPLWLAMETIEATAAKWAEGKAPRRFLQRCDEGLARRIAEIGWRPPSRPDSRPGSAAPDAGAVEAAKGRALTALDGAADRLAATEPALADAIRQARRSVESSPATAGDLGRALTVAREDLAKAAISCIPPKTLLRFEEEEERRLATMAKRMSARVAAEALRDLVRDRLLAHYDLPPLALADLLPPSS